MRPESKPKLGATRAVPSSLSMSQTNRYSQLRGNNSNPFADDDETTEVNFRPSSTKSPLQQENSSPSRRSAPRRSLPLPPRPLPPPPPPKRPSNSGVEMTRVVRGSNPFDVEEGKDDNRDSTRSESSTADEPDEDEQPVPGSDGKPIMRTKEENKIIRFLVSKRVYKYPGCTDSWCSNYFSYISNNHPFFSMIFVHYLHPFGRRQRLMVFLNGIFFAIFISFVMFETTLVPRVSDVISHD